MSFGLKKIGNFLITKENLIDNLKIPQNKTLAVMIDLSDYADKNGLKYLKKNFRNKKV